MMRLSHTQRTPNTQYRCRFDTVQAANITHRRPVFAGNGSQRITRTNLVIAHRLTLGPLLLVLLLVSNLILEILAGTRIDAEITAFQQEDIPTKRSRLKINQSLGVERLDVVTCLEVQVRAR